MTAIIRSLFTVKPEPSGPIVELRQYTLHPGRRDFLIDLFDRKFVESQELVGMSVIGQFRDVDDPDRFVWLRGFPDLAWRARSLEAFYGGPVWAKYRQAANETMIDLSNVLVLSQARPSSGFAQVRLSERLPVNAARPSAGLVVAGICSLEIGEEQRFIDHFEDRLEPALERWGGVVLAYFLSDGNANNFPALPVRDDANVFVWVAGFADRTTAQQLRSGRGEFGLAVADAPGMNAPPEVLRLDPTTRSLLTGTSPPCAAVQALVGD